MDAMFRNIIYYTIIIVFCGLGSLFAHHNDHMPDYEGKGLEALIVHQLLHSDFTQASCTSIYIHWAENDGDDRHSRLGAGSSQHQTQQPTGCMHSVQLCRLTVGRMITPS
jgi:hypothetical protein